MTTFETGNILALIGRTWPDDDKPPELLAEFKSAVCRRPFEIVRNAVLAEALAPNRGKYAPLGDILKRVRNAMDSELRARYEPRPAPGPVVSRRQWLESLPAEERAKYENRSKA